MHDNMHEMPRGDLKKVQDLLELHGPTRGPILQRALGIGQSTFSRLLAQNDGSILVAGARKNRVYAALRQAGDAKAYPLFRVAPDGGAERAAVLYPVAPRGFYVESGTPDFASAFHDDLPYFLYDQRPAGFLGRAIPRRHPELGAPAKIQDWSGDHCLRYFAAYGWDLPGDLVLSEAAYGLFMRQRHAAEMARSPENRMRRYDAIAADVVAEGPAGSSAGGEQPKFLFPGEPGRPAVLVKFSPAADDASARRVKDLLVCEHIALETLRQHGVDACRSTIFTSGQRTFLEVERFDRLAGGGRRGVLSLSALDLHFVGSTLQRWSEAVSVLVRENVLSPPVADSVRRLELFGELIGNTDMHPGNLSFFARGEQVEELTPCYDMLPMVYAPQHGELPPSHFEPPMPRPSDGPWWRAVHRMARTFWTRAATDERVSTEFRSIAGENTDKVDALQGVDALLPR